MTFALGKFNDVFYGNEEVDDWYTWDKNFIMQEQVTKVAPIVYEKAAKSNPEGVKTINDIAHNRGIFCIGATFGGKHFFPDFSLWNNSDLSSKITDYGAQARYKIPMHMLYYNKFNNESGLTNKKKMQIHRAFKGINEFYEKIKINLSTEE